MLPELRLESSTLERDLSRVKTAALLVTPFRSHTCVQGIKIKNRK